MDARVVVVGAGPAGLTAAYELARMNLPPVVLEKGDKVGGLACTENYRGFHFDMGGHRFFTKVPAVARIWRDVLGRDFLTRPRLSRIYFNGKFFPYPLQPAGTLGVLGLRESVLVGLSYLRWQVAPYSREDTFEQWVTNRFGRRLFRTFFKTYTEKVWGVSCAELRAEWAAQRIKDLSFRTAVMNMLVRQRRTITTLIEQFEYPRLGPGMMWNAVRAEIERRGGTVHLGREVIGIRRDGDRIVEVVARENGGSRAFAGTHFVSSMPVTELVARLDPPAPADVATAAGALRYRDFLTVCLIVDRADVFPDNWIYVHDPDVRVGRIQNFKNWSPDMVPDAGKTSLGLEYFCSEGDDLWNASDAELIDLGSREVERLGLARRDEVQDGCVVRVPKAYPVYDASYREHLARVRSFVDGLANLATVGRNGLHRYNNQDHAMLTGMLAVRNLVHGERNDLWSVNTEQEYHEEIQAAVGSATAEALEEVTLVPGFGKLDRIALGLALGLVGGVGLFLASLFLLVKGGPHVGYHLNLLGQFLPGYRVSSAGMFVGLAWGLVGGFVAGWTFAVLRNAVALFVLTVVRRRAEAQLLRRLLDYV
ncbi:MAG TPA: NAD(P)/FAD-dependent oxidoreductase [Candidatus Binatia bacterium]|nr:NAD(P)/FAD-dependent oxidoreductase [Candidatus Binatia bacterium]